LFGYTGREQGDGLWHYRAREYRADIGRFISEDPVRFEEGPNFYVYVFDNPIAYTDPSGLQCGPGGMGDAGFFNKRWGADFSGPCANHDKCYSTCGVPKSTCDNNFLSQMQAVCSGKGRKSFAFMKYSCLKRAETYYALVAQYGDTAYRQGQATACAACKIPPKRK
jgi:RHS repeat-associated protein